MKTISGELKCPECPDSTWYSDLAYEGCFHYCPECGAKMELTGRKVKIIDYSRWLKLQDLHYKVKDGV